jgi:hypothetical protein
MRAADVLVVTVRILADRRSFDGSTQRIVR